MSRRHAVGFRRCASHTTRLTCVTGTHILSASPSGDISRSQGRVPRIIDSTAPQDTTSTSHAPPLSPRRPPNQHFTPSLRCTATSTSLRSQKTSDEANCTVVVCCHRPSPSLLLPHRRKLCANAGLSMVIAYDRLRHNPTRERREAPSATARW